ncbi:MAG: DUF2339 domain-containing protein [Candidatus Rifleibacteriota bacterium]
MFYLILIAFIGALICFPLFFVMWVIHSIRALLRQLSLQQEENERLTNRFLRLQSSFCKLEKKIEDACLPETSSISSTDTPIPEDNKPKETAQKELIGKIADRKLPTKSLSESESATASINPSKHSPKPQALTPEKVPSSAKISKSKGNGQIPVAEPKPYPPTAPSSVKADWANIDMESLIGGNLMSKVGALLLVIGLALFLKYSLGSMGPLAKLSAGALLGALLLAWGIVQHKNDSNQVLSLGLIGGGWACLYLTAFAAHGVEATKVLESPLAGMALILAVATGMIFHSLRFTSETATGLAFLFAFIALFVSEVSLYSEIAAVILTIGMLVLSFHYSWHQLAVSGLILTYGSMLARLHWCAPASELSAMAQLSFVQILLLINWATFELLGMNFIRRKGLQSEEPTRFIFIANFFAYSIISLFSWPSEASCSLLAGLLGLQYLISGPIRGFWCRAPGEAAIERQSFFLGSFEDSLAIAVASSCVWLWYVLPAVGVAIGWALIGLLTIEIAFRAPWQLLRFTGHSIMTLTFFRVFVGNMSADDLSMGISYRLISVLPIIALMVHLHFRTNVEMDFESVPGGGTRFFAPVYLYFATALAAFLLRFEIGPGLTAPAWALVAVVLTLLGNKINNPHLARQAIILMAGALAFGLSTDFRNDGAGFATSSPWAIGTITIFAMYLCRKLAKNDDTHAKDSLVSFFDLHRKQICSLAGSFSLAFLLYLQISGGYLTLAWAAMGISLLLAGFFIRDRALRLTGLSAAMICILKVFLYDARVLDAPLRILAFICLGGALLLISLAYTKFKDRFQELL